MMKNIGKVALLASLGFAGQLLATEFRAPIAVTNGPLYYSFDKLHKKKSNFTMWTVGEMRESSETFIKHGTDTHPLSQLFFGKSKFKVGEAFQDANATKWGYTENFSPFLDLTYIAPRVSYSERGVIWGASWDYPVWKNKGRIGIRASVPFKYVRMERDDEAEQIDLGVQEHIVKGDIRFTEKYDASKQNNGAGTLNSISSYRLNLLKTLIYIDQNGFVMPFFRYNTDHKYVSLRDKYDAARASEYGEKQIPFVVVKSKIPGQPPYHTGGAELIKASDGSPQNNWAADNVIIYPDAEQDPYNNPQSTNKLIELTADGGLTEGRAGVFKEGTDYSNMALNTKASNDQFEDYWVTTIHGGADGGVLGNSSSAVDFIDNLLQRYAFEPTQWLQDQGFQLQSNEDTSFGDITAEVFYEHCFSDNWRGELELGVKFPTGCGGSDYNDEMYNVYRVQLGNGSHWEIKLGGLLAWQALDWMNIKLDAAVNFAIEDTEQRCAAYKGATVKNFGPRADAEVDWVSFVGNLDFNFTHPKTKKIKGLIGYQFYYKSEDHVDFKDSKAASWLGKVWGTAANTAAIQTKKGDGWYDLTMDLSGEVAEMNTEQIAHRLRMEGAYSLSKYITVAVGGLYTFAGQNIPAEADLHAGCNVRF